MGRVHLCSLLRARFSTSCFSRQAGIIISPFTCQYLISSSNKHKFEIVIISFCTGSGLLQNYKYSCLTANFPRGGGGHVCASTS